MNLIQLIIFNLLFIILLEIIYVNTDTNITVIKENLYNKKLSRQKRYIVFPEGSSFSVACCMTIGVIGNPNYQFLSWALNWGIAYELPTNISAFRGDPGSSSSSGEEDESKPATQRRFRRDLYNKIEIAMNDMGYNGRECILRAICESSQYFSKKGANMIEELIRTIFSLPKTKVLSSEHKDVIIYDAAHKHGLKNKYCPLQYPKCGFSLIDLALGRYSKPYFNYM